MLIVWTLVVGLLASHPSAGAAADITYLYDRLGRLVAVVDPASDTAVYSYDAVGNLLSITRQSSLTVAIIAFDPPSGPVGATVTIQGTGFSTTPAQNAVTVNGVAATVSSASATQLVITVPAGATTGTIGVTAPGGSATSASPFTVTTSNGSPTIASFTPAVGTVGTAISVSGTNFETTPANNRLKFNVAQGIVTTATTTGLSVPVPVGATSGRLTLATPGGITQSADDFFVPPGSYTAAKVSGTGRISIGGATGSATITGGDKIALLVFEGTAGQQVSLGVGVGGGVTIADTYIFRPDGAQLAWLYTEFYGGDYHIAALPVTGTYTIMVAPRGNYSGTKGITLSQDLMVGAITVGGSSVGVNITRPGQRARMTFAGTAGQRLNLGFSAFWGSVTVTKPDGTTFASYTGNSDFALVMPPLPSTGTYGILVDPPGVETPNLTFTLSEEVSASIAIDGASVPISLTRAGQVARVTFSGTSGQRLNLALTDSTFPWPTWMSVQKPDGSSLWGGNIGSGAGVIDLGPLPTTGTYTVVVDPAQGNTGSLTFYLSQEINGTITIGGSSVSTSVSRPAQKTRLTFSGTASQRISLVVTGVTTTGSLGVSLINPDGSLLSWWPNGSAMTVYNNGSGFIGPFTVPSTQTNYALLVAPNAPAGGGLTAQLYDVPADPTAAVTINGAAATLTFSTPGQNGTVTFAATSGQALTLRMANSNLGCLYNFALSRPGGGYTSWTPICGTSFTVGVTASTGTHTIIIDPNGATTGSADISVTSP